MNLLRYHDVDLPTYPPDSFAQTGEDISTAARSGVESFFRRVCLRYDGPERSLKSALELGDRVLQASCVTVGADMVVHDWGLAVVSPTSKIDPLYDNRITSDIKYADSLIPSGYGLIAKVQTVRNARPINNEQGLQLENAWESDKWDSDILSIAEGPYRYSNVDFRNPEQFVSAPNPLHPEDKQIICVDVEPRLQATLLRHDRAMQ